MTGPSDEVYETGPRVFRSGVSPAVGRVASVAVVVAMAAIAAGCAAPRPTVFVIRPEPRADVLHSPPGRFAEQTGTVYRLCVDVFDAGALPPPDPPPAVSPALRAPPPVALYLHLLRPAPPPIWDICPNAAADRISVTRRDAGRGVPDCLLARLIPPLGNPSRVVAGVPGETVSVTVSLGPGRARMVARVVLDRLAAPVGRSHTKQRWETVGSLRYYRRAGDAADVVVIERRERELRAREAPGTNRG